MNKPFLSLLICFELIIIAFVALPLFQKTHIPDLPFESVQAYEVYDCFIAGTQVLMADGTSKAIEDVVVGESVLSFNTMTKRIEPQPVLLTTSNTHSEYMTIAFENGATNTNTIEQPYLVKGKGWASYDPLGTLKKFKLLVRQLEVGDTAFSYENNTLKEVLITKITRHDGYIRTYNLYHIKDTNTYFANGIVVHNKGSSGVYSDWHKEGKVVYDRPSRCGIKKCTDVKACEVHPCPNECQGGQSDCDATLGHTEGELFQDKDGNWWWAETDENEKGGTKGLDREPSIPEIPCSPPEDCSGTIKAVGIYGDASYLRDCTKLLTLKTCIDDPAKPECGAIPGTKGCLNESVYFLTGYHSLQQHSCEGVTWTEMPVGIGYILTAMDSTETYIPNIYCYKTTSAPEYVKGYEAMLKSDETVEFLVGFGPILPWFQIQGGNTYGGKSVVSYLATTTVIDPFYDKTVSPASPGILSAVNGIDLTDSLGSYGFLKISYTNWNSDSANDAKDWYSFFKQRIMSVPKHIYSGGEKPSMVAGETTSVYTKTGNVTTSDSWVVGSTDSLVIQVEGNLTIQDPITIQNGGFLAFIVSGDIQVSGDVGTTYSSVVPVLEGIYIAKGKIMTGTSLTLAKERLVARGVFIADNILSQRTLVTSVHNKDTSADLFIFNPNLVMNTPEMLMDIPYIWQEVAP